MVEIINDINRKVECGQLCVVISSAARNLKAYRDSSAPRTSSVGMTRENVCFYH